MHSCARHMLIHLEVALPFFPIGRRPRLHTLSKFFHSSFYAELQQHLKLIKLVENLYFFFLVVAHTAAQHTEGVRGSQQLIGFQHFQSEWISVDFSELFNSVEKEIMRLCWSSGTGQLAPPTYSGAQIQTLVQLLSLNKSLQTPHQTGSGVVSSPLRASKCSIFLAPTL